MKIKPFIISLMALVCSVATRAEELPAIEPDTTAVAVVDSIVADPDPEWYVAPLDYDSVMSFYRAPRRAAATCPIDSVLTFNIDSILTEVTVYEYGDTTRTSIWTVNTDGSRIGKSRDESYTSALITFTATYDWDNTTNNWKGTAKTEYIYNDAGLMAFNTSYAWLNHDWQPDTRYAYTYDASNREVEYIYYIRNANNQLVPNKSRVQSWYNSSYKLFEIQYTAHNGTAWSAGTKKEYAYDASGNQVEYIYYSSYSNGVWNKSTREVWEYASGQKTLNEKYTWSNNNWVGSSKEVWAFNTSGKQTLHEKYGWSNGDWIITLQENSGYDAAGNNTLVENYSFTNGVAKGTKKEEYTFNAAKKKTCTIKYKWSNSAWICNTKAMTGYDAAGNTIETANYTWSSGAWVGTGTRTLKTYNSSKKLTEQISQSWSAAMNDWVNVARQTAQYSGSNTTQEASYTWDTDHWVGTSRSDWHYNAKGQNDTIKTYTNNGTEWIYSNRTVNTYNAAGTNIMTHNAAWDAETSMWTMTSMTRTDIIKDAAGHELLNAQWRCSSDSIWVGVQKDTSAFTTTGKQLYFAKYTSWANGDWVPSYKQTFVYDEASRMLLNERYNWNSNQWQGSFRYEYGYDEQGRQNYSATFNSWSSVTDSWVGTTMTETVFNAAGQTIEKKLYNWQNNGWAAFNRYLYTYDAEGHLIDQVVQSYSNNEWQNVFRYEKGYLENLLVLSNDYTWRNDAWYITSKSVKTYDEDAQAKLRREIAGRWNASGAVTSFSDKYYAYACDVQSYTIQFVNYDGTLLKSVNVQKGQVPEYNGTTPTKPATEQYTYTFTGWNPTIAAVTADAVYTAQYDSVVNEYPVVFLNEDGTKLDSMMLAYGATPTTSVIPSKPATAEYSYEFAGWNPTIAEVTAAATYTATYTNTTNNYTVVFQNYDGTELQSSTLAYGATPEYTETEPSKPATAQYTYTFTGWNPAIAAVTADAVYTAQYDSVVNEYPVVFRNEDGTKLDSMMLAYGETPTTLVIPSKPATAEYSYEFADWTPAIAEVTGAATYTATFTNTTNNYTITFYYEDGVTKFDEVTVSYGETPTTQDVPSKPADEGHTYTFVGWSPEVVPATENASYVATFDTIVNTYSVTFKNYDGTVLLTTEVAYGTVPTYTGETPTRAATAQYTYTFNGWTPELTAVTGAATYTAQFDSVVNEYPVVFRNEDGTKLDSMMLAYGATPTTTVIPSKPATAEYTYEFAGWTPAIAEVTGAATYTATYTNTTNNYTVVFQNYDGTELQSSTLAYGATPEYTGTPSKPATAQYTYNFTGWNPTIAEVTADAVYTAQYDSVVNKYTITFKNGEQVLQSTEVEYGVMPAYNGTTPTKAADAEYSYEFNGWSPEIVTVTGEATYNATFTSTTNNYTITFYYEDGVTKFDEVTVSYGETPTTQDVPSKPADEGHTYTFAGWSPEVVPATEDASYIATFDTIVNTYSVTFKNYDGTVLLTTEVAYGTVPTYTGETPTKAATAQFTYTFNGWTPELTAVTGAATYTATFSSTVNKYTITFYDEDGVTVLEQTNVAYGEMPNPFVTPTKEEDDEYTYEFAGWTPSLKFVTEDASYYATYTATKKTDGLWDINAGEKATKVMIDGHVYILRGGKTYTLDGTMVE